MARFSVLIFPFAFALLLASADGWARDKYGGFTGISHETCGYYLDVYSRTKLVGAGGFDGPYEAWKVVSWINGWLSAYNEFRDNGKKNILGGMTVNDARRWVAAC